MAFRNTHPYESGKNSPAKEDVVKTFKNHNKAISLFCLITILMIFVYTFFFLFAYRETDISLVVVGILLCIVSYIIHNPLFKILNKLFKDPSKGVYFMSFMVVGPFIIGTLLWINSLITFESAEEKVRVIGQEIYRSRKGTPTYVLQLENNHFLFQPGFRGSNAASQGKYVHYRFRRGILGLRILEGTYYSNN